MVFRVASSGGSSGLVIGAGATPITGGTASRVLFEGAGNVLSESADLTVASGVLTIGGSTAGAGLVITGGSVSTDIAPLSFTQTRNNGAIAFSGALKIAITDTASANGSFLIQCLGGVAGTTNQFNVDKNGNIGIFSAGSASMQFGTINAGAAPRTGMIICNGTIGSAGDLIGFTQNSSAMKILFGTTAGQIQVASGGGLVWANSASDATATLDTWISRLSAGVTQFGTTTANFSGRIKFTSAIAAGVAVANLNAAPTQGEIQTVTDALAPVVGNPVAAGGAAFAAVIRNATVWQVFAV